MSNIKNIFISVNSPGEIASWMKPTVKAIKKKLPNCIIKALLLPCVFASGTEKKVIESIPEIDEVIPSRDFIKMAFSHEKRSNAYFIHLGGDLALTAFIAARRKTFAWGYQWGTKASDKAYAGYFVKSESDKKILLERGIPEFKIYVIGDLLYDSVMTDIEGGIPSAFSGRVKNIAFMCGSRMKELKALLPFYLKVAKLLKERDENLEFKTLISPFIDLDEFLSSDILEPEKGFPGCKTVVDGKKNVVFAADAPSVSIRLVYSNLHEEMNSADFIISIPGTKTGEAASLEKPMIVIMPLNRPDQIPFFGLVGLLDWVPLIGRKLKGLIILKAARTFGFTAQPNILAGKEIVPELRGVISPEGAADAVWNVLSDPSLLSNMRNNLAEIYRPFKGASERLADIFLESILADENPDKPYLSVIICTRNRKKLLEGTLLTLDDQTLPSSAYEIIVVDDGSEDGTEEVVKALTLKCRLKYMRKDWGGRSETRNLGLKEAVGEICVFVDDDILADKNFLKNHASWHRMYPSSIVRGPIVNIPEYKIPDYKITFKDFSAAIFCTCNASAPRKALTSLGGFDETFREYGYEDNEMGWRLYKLGLKVRFNADAVVFHYKPYKTIEALPGDIRNSQEMARSAMRFYRKHKHWKVSLSTKINFFDLTLFRLTSCEPLNRLYMKIWRFAALRKKYGVMSFLESKIKNYYYMKTLIEELKSNPKGEFKDESHSSDLLDE